ncbi:phosphoribosyltransferase [Streptococcus pneumoniae]|nr:phosphoribosyltransferase [Streptococcus pneumoniae]MBW5194944.1 phosphoribosyltransferase [Streptococcus pneumoniae]MDG7290841.1 phosphoribosyltransferase [Streptococcus pneumoniae]MDG7657687.1 phosphoribosyltransferase [Streptococcus pneumoniae]MDG9073905.1 phosphoribosyltransferase [Streptococcus pneumoniae]
MKKVKFFIKGGRKFINGERIGYRIDKEKLLKIPKGSNIILVEDIVDSGQTLSEVKKYLESSNIKYIFCILNIGNYNSSNLFSCRSSIFLNTENVFSLRHLIYGEKTSNFHTEINKYFFDNDALFLELIDEATNVT